MRGHADPDSMTSTRTVTRLLDHGYRAAVWWSLIRTYTKGNTMAAKTATRVQRTHTTVEYALRFDRSDRLSRNAIRDLRRTCTTMGVSEIKGRRWPVLKNPKATGYAALAADPTPDAGAVVPLDVELDTIGETEADDLDLGDPDALRALSATATAAAAYAWEAPEPKWRNIAANDVAYSWDTSTWKAIATKTEVLRRSWWLGKARHDDAFGLPMAVLEDRDTGFRLAGAMLHMPAKVNGAYRMVNGVPVPKTARAVGHLWFAHTARRKLRKFARQHQADAVQLCADVNLSWFDSWVPKWFRSIYRHWTCCWEKFPPKVGTHAGRRLIDWIWMLGAVFIDAEVLKDRPKVSDHRAIRTTWRFKRTTPLNRKKAKK